MTKKTLLLATGFVLLWNSGFIGAEFGFAYTGPFSLLFWRYLALTFVLFFYLLFRNRLRWYGRRNAVTNMAIGVLSHGVWLGCVSVSLHYGVPAGVVALVVALQPVATGAFSGLVVGEPTPLYRWAGLAVGFAGVAITVMARMDPTDTGSVFAYLIPLGSVIGITVATLWQRKLEFTRRAYLLPTDLTLFYQSLATTAVMIVPAFALEGINTSWEPGFIYTMSWLILGVSLSAYALMWLLIERMDATRVASLFYLGPPVTFLMARVALGDTLLTTDVVGLLVVFAGVAMTQLSSKYRASVSSGRPLLRLSHIKEIPFRRS